MRTTAVVVLAMAMSAGAWAGEPPAQAAQATKPAGRAPVESGATGASWDDSHMQSRYGETQSSGRPRISGQTGYAAIANRNAEASPAQVQPLQFTTQREWEMGQLSTGSRDRARAAESASRASGPTRPDRSDGLRGESFTSGSRH